MNLSEKQFAVIGLGRFGSALCEELRLQGAQVLALDIAEDKVSKLVDVVSHAVVADCSNEATVAELKLDEYDIVMVSIGDDVNASILTTLVLKEAGVRAVWVKAKDKYHAKILNKIGADKIISPERDMGIRIARNMLDKRVFDYLQLGSGLAIAEVVITRENFGVPLGQHICVKKSSIDVLAVKRGPIIHRDFGMDVPLEIGDILIVAGKEEELADRLKHL